MPFRQYDPVRLRVARPDLGLKKGATGIIVDVYSRPRQAYEVEFLSAEGQTLGVWTIDPSELESDARRRGQGR